MDYATGAALGIQQQQLLTLDNFELEPQTRARSNTWPCQPRGTFGASGSSPSGGGQGLNGAENEGESTPPPMAMETMQQQQQQPPHPQQQQQQFLLKTKSSSRRNAWGNLSYADLITQAISSSPEKRLTLSQIYDWMVTNVPYFKDKGDSNSSAGWKNSIRHNLSLHNRFVRVQNEGTGKSSWWMLNPDAKPGKAARRRATSMETSKYEKKRGRIKKKIDAIRNGTSLIDTSSPCSSVSEGLDLFPDSPQVLPSTFQLSPSDFRPRASSNASSVGRLSPILGGNETDLHDNNWEYNNYAFGGGEARFNADILAGSLANTMKLSDFAIDFNAQQQPTFTQQTFGDSNATNAAQNPNNPTQQQQPTNDFKLFAQEPVQSTNDFFGRQSDLVDFNFVDQALGQFDVDDLQLQTELPDLLQQTANAPLNSDPIMALHHHLNGGMGPTGIPQPQPQSIHSQPVTSSNTPTSTFQHPQQQELLGRQWVH